MILVIDHKRQQQQKLLIRSCNFKNKYLKTIKQCFNLYLKKGNNEPWGGKITVLECVATFYIIKM